MSRDPLTDSERDTKNTENDELRSANAELEKDVILLEKARSLQRENRKLDARLTLLESDEAQVIAAEDARAELLAQGQTVDDD